jgi:hypothetical protein
VLKAGISRGQSSQVRSIPAPCGGWNARDVLADMPPTDAVSLVNWFPGTTSVNARFGYTNYATGFSGQVETLTAYAGGAANQLFAWSGGNVYNVSSTGAIGAPVHGGNSNNRWQTINLATPGGNFLVAVNGVDAPLLYDGSAWHSITATSTPYAITGLPGGIVPANFTNVTLAHNRVWFTLGNTLQAWYLPTESVAGAANVLDLSAFALRGGYLVAIGTWTVASALAVNNYTAFVTSQGEVLVYAGNDPSSATTWSLAGVWRIGEPVGQRCMMMWGTDLLLITQDGIYSMSTALQNGRIDPNAALSQKIMTAVSSAITSYGGNFGWQLCYFAGQNMLLLNVPVAAGGSQQQYVMNTMNKSWCSFNGWSANCFEIFNQQLFFGGNGVVGQAWNGLSDAGSNINLDGFQAFSALGGPGQQKQVKMMRPVVASNGAPSLNCNVNVDFDTSDTTAPLAFSPVSYAAWDVALWDEGLWAGGLTVTKNWQGATGLGNYFAPRLKAASQGIQIQWASTDIVFEAGAVL